MTPPRIAAASLSACAALIVALSRDGYSASAGTVRAWEERSHWLGTPCPFAVLQECSGALAADLLSRSDSTNRGSLNVAASEGFNALYESLNRVRCAYDDPMVARSGSPRRVVRVGSKSQTHPHKAETHK